MSVSADVAIQADTRWYKPEETEFTLTTAAQLYGFSSLAATNNFSGKTIKLGANISLNSGNASDWATSAPTCISVSNK